MTISEWWISIIVPFGGNAGRVGFGVKKQTNQK
jgi:hypothetical protein